MSESDFTSPPPVADPPPPRISDRAALEAALAGAAGLLLGRVLLGRGAGLLAGTAAVAARLLADTAGKNRTADPASEETAEAPSPAADSPARETTPPAWAVPEPTDPPAPPASEPELEQPVASAGETPEGPFFALPPVEAEPAADEPAVPFLATSPEQEPATTTGEADPFIPDETLPIPQIPARNEAGELPETKTAASFSQLFAEFIPPAAPSPETIPTHLPQPEEWTHPVADHAGALTAFPALPDPTDWDREPAPAPSAQPETEALPQAVPGLSHFPNTLSVLPHPEDIWKMAAAEAPDPDANQVESTTETTPLQPLPLIEPGQANPFLTLLEAAPAPGLSVPVEPAALPPAEVTAFLAEPVAAAAPLPPVRIESLSPPDDYPGRPASPVPASEPVPTLTLEPADPTHAPPAAGRNPDELPVISLKARTARNQEVPAVFTELIPAPAAPAALADDKLPRVKTDVFAPLSTRPPPAGEVSPVSAAANAPAPGSSRKFWLILLLLLAAVAAWLYRRELRQPVDSGAPPSTSAAQPTPPPNPVLPSPPPPSPQPAPAVPPPAPLPDKLQPALRPAPPAEQKAAAIPAPPTDTAMPAPPELGVFAEPTPGVPQEFAPGSVEAKAKQALEKVLAARSIDELGPWIHDPAATARKAARWFPDGNPQPLTARRILFDASETMPRSTRRASLFRVVTDEVPLGFPVAVEDTAQGPRIDFEAFVQCRDRRLDAFMADRTKEPEAFIVQLRRGHYFGDDLTAAELEKLICFEISAPNPGSPKHRVFIPRDSALGHSALRRFTWDKTYTPLVELTRTRKTVEILSVVRDTWRVPGS